MRSARIIVSVIVAGFLVGCQSANEPQGDGFGGSGHSPLTPRNEFERSSDPPMNAKTHFAAGRLAESQENYTQAIEQYWAVLKIEPRHRETIYRLGIVYTQLKHYDEAIVAWKKYAAVTDGDATACSNLGFCCELAGRAAEAETAYKQGIAKDPKSNPCRVNYGLMLARMGRTNEAIIQLQAVLSTAEVHYNLASVHEHMGRKEAARAEYEKALQADPKFSEAAIRLAALK